MKLARGFALLAAVNLVGCNSESTDPSAWIKTDAGFVATDTIRPPRRDSLAGGDSQTASAGHAIVVIHADPGSATVANWSRLAAIIATATTHGHKISILLGADWGDLIMDSSVRKTIVAKWVQNGHQLGFHHHDCTHAEPDRYHDMVSGSDDTNMQGAYAECTTATALEGYLGSVADAFAKVKRIGDEWLFQSVANGGAGLTRTTSTDLIIAAQGGLKDYGGVFRDYEWQPGVTYATGNVTDNQGSSGSTLSKPTCHTYGSVVLSGEIGHTQMKIGNFRTSTKTVDNSQIATDIENVAPDQVVGVVFHAHEYANEDGYTDKDTIDAMFQLLTDANLMAETVTTVVDALGCS